MFSPPNFSLSDADTADAALLARCRTGDIDAFGLLVKRHDARVSALAASLLGPESPAEATDALVQEVFLELWRGLPDTRFSTRLYRLTVSKAVKQWGKVRRKPDPDDADLPLTVGAALASLTVGPADPAALRARDRELRTAIDGLPEPMRTAILVHYGAGFSSADAAEMIGCSEDDLWARLSEACRTLRESALWLGT